jgi:hypothetical protein
MKKTLLYSLFLLFTTGLLGQQELTVNPSPVIKELSAEDDEVKVEFTITNNSSRDTEIWWNFDSGTSPDEWEFFVCDLNLCYTPSVTSCPCSKANFLAGESDNLFSMTIIPNGAEGTGIVNMRITDVCDGTTSTLEIPITYMVGETSSTSFQDINNKINIYPNPSSQSMNIMHDEEVREIIIYNLIGKKIRRVKHTPGQSHNISDLDRGIYLIRMLNKQQNILKVSRLTKR